jgi:hypothetical protein
MKKVMSITWSDSDEKNKGETTNKVIAFTDKYETSSNTSNEDLIDEELAEPYRILVTKWEEACILVDRHKKTLKALFQYRGIDLYCY